MGALCLESIPRGCYFGVNATMALASVLGRIVCSVRAVVPPVRGVTSAAGGLCSAAALKRAPVLSSTVSLRYTVSYTQVD